MRKNRQNRMNHMVQNRDRFLVIGSVLMTLVSNDLSVNGVTMINVQCNFFECETHIPCWMVLKSGL